MFGDAEYYDMFTDAYVVGGLVWTETSSQCLMNACVRCSANLNRATTKDELDVVSVIDYEECAQRLSTDVPVLGAAWSLRYGGDDALSRGRMVPRGAHGVRQGGY